MKALSLWQPWASAIFHGLKRIETRHWSTSYRGPLLIHAAKKWDRDLAETAAVEQEAGRLPADLPFGALIGRVRLFDIRPTEQLAATIGEVERQWGNYGPHRFGWVFEDIEPLAAAVPWKGMQGLFDVPEGALTGEVAMPPAAAPVPAPPPRQGSLL